MNYPDDISTPEQYVAWLKTLAGDVMVPRLDGGRIAISAHTLRRGGEVHRWAIGLNQREDDTLHNGADPTTIRPEYYRGQTPLNQLLMLEMG